MPDQDQTHPKPAEALPPDEFQQIPIRSRPLPPLPPNTLPYSPGEGSGRAFSRHLATEEQHLKLRLISWFLSKTNPDQSQDPTEANLNVKATTASNVVVNYKDRQRRELYELAEAFCHLVERNHESISALPADSNAFRLVVSRTHSSPPPDTLDYITVDAEEVILFGHTLEFPEEYYMPHFPRTEAEAARQQAGEDPQQTPVDTTDEPDLTAGLPLMPTWGHDVDSFTTRLFKMRPFDPPFGPKGGPIEQARNHGFWLMRHTLEKVDDTRYLSDVYFTEHLGNIVEGIRRTHEHKTDDDALHIAHMNLSLYVYLNCASRSAEKARRGVKEYSFGRVLTTPLSRLLKIDPKAHERVPRVTMNDEPYNLPVQEKTLTRRQRRYMKSLLAEGLPLCKIHHELLDPERPDGLLRRGCFYDTDGRKMFHVLVTTVIGAVMTSVADLVKAKRIVMDLKNTMRFEKVPFERMEQLNNTFVDYLRPTVLSFKMLDVLRDEFPKVFTAHVAWVSDIFAAAPTSARAKYTPPASPRPPGLHDEFAGLATSTADPHYALSALHWIKLLCQQEYAMRRLRYPLHGNGSRRLEPFSVHVTNCTPLYLRVSPPADRAATAPLHAWLHDLGYTSDERDTVLTYLVSTSALTPAEADGAITFRGCVHAPAAQLLLSYIQRRRMWIEIGRRDYERLQRAALEDHAAPLLPARSVTDVFADAKAAVLATNRPCCEGCRLMVQRALTCGVFPGTFVHHGGVTGRWAMFDMPPWATRDTMRVLINEAEDVAFQRVGRLLRQAARAREEAVSEQGE